MTFSGVGQPGRPLGDNCRRVVVSLEVDLMVYADLEPCDHRSERKMDIAPANPLHNVAYGT